jgi:hypothetical protein
MSTGVSLSPPCDALGAWNAEKGSAEACLEGLGQRRAQRAGKDYIVGVLGGAIGKASAQFQPGEALSLHRVDTGVTAGKVAQDVGEALSRHCLLSRRIVQKVWGGLKE